MRRVEGGRWREGGSWRSYGGSGTHVWQEKQLVSKGAVSEGANENVDFDANGKRKRRDSDFVAYNHKPEEIVDKSMVAAAAIKASLKSGDAKSGMAGGSAAGGGATGGGGAVGGDGGGKAPNAGSGKGKPAQPQQAQQPKKPQQAQPQQPPKPKPQPQPQQTQQPQQQERIEMAHLPADVSIIKARFKNRKFLLPLLDQGPNNQFLQMRVALAKAHSMNRTLVLPVWLPHNPKFQHFHPGAPNVPSRDKKLDAISHPFESTFDPELLSRFVRTIDLAAFRLLTDGHVELCWAESKARHTAPPPPPPRPHPAPTPPPPPPPRPAPNRRRTTRPSSTRTCASRAWRATSTPPSPPPRRPSWLRATSATTPTTTRSATGTATTSTCAGPPPSRAMLTRSRRRSSTVPSTRPHTSVWPMPIGSAPTATIPSTACTCRRTLTPTFQAQPLARTDPTPRRTPKPEPESEPNRSSHPLTSCPPGVRVPSVSCGDGQNVINYTSLAQEMWHVLRQAQHTEMCAHSAHALACFNVYRICTAHAPHSCTAPAPHTRTLARGHMQADKKLLYIATNMECSDLRLVRMSKMLEQRAVRTVCAQEQARQELGSDDNYFLSVVEQARGTRTCTCTACALHDMNMNMNMMHCIGIP